MTRVISIIGKANVGKSWLFNNLVQDNISVVTNKRYTTNRCVEYLYNKDILLIDTPGPIIKKLPLDFYNINKFVYSAINKSDSLIIVITKELTADDFFVLNLIKNVNKKKFLIISKCDKIKIKKDLLILIDKLNKYSYFDVILPYSNVTALNLNRLSYLVGILDQQEKMSDSLLYNVDYKTIIDIVRKALLLTLVKELPYNIDIVIKNNESINEIKTLLVELILKKKCYKKILIGENGIKIKEIIKYIHFSLSFLFLNIRSVKIEIKY